VRVILQREVEGLGLPGDVVEVKDGYARNYLIPRNLATPATRGAIRHAERLRQAHEKRVRAALEAAREAAGRLAATPIRVPARAGGDGRLFGSITPHQLTRAIEEATGIEVDRRQIHAEPIRSVGTHEVSVRLHPEVTATVTVEVVPEG
jgi:large subunit ribosomal protein L9